MRPRLFYRCDSRSASWPVADPVCFGNRRSNNASVQNELTTAVQETITNEPVRYIEEGARLLISKLLAVFQVYFRETSEHWVESIGVSRTLQESRIY